MNLFSDDQLQLPTTTSAVLLILHLRPLHSVVMLVQSYVTAVPRRYATPETSRLSCIRTIDLVFCLQDIRKNERVADESRNAVAAPPLPESERLSFRHPTERHRS